MEQVWTILKIINWGVGYLSERKIDDARLNIELMLCHVLKMNRVQLYSNFEQPLTKNELAELKSMLKRRIAHEPLQYIIGETYFYGLKFFCDKNVLIPRPETELLIEQFTKQVKESNFTLLDIGTGSGCIAVTLAKFFPESEITALDISPYALSIAQKNAELHNVNINFVEADIFTFSSDLVFDYIISNPPYIPKSEIKDLQPEILLHEPEFAYTDNNDGLIYYRKFRQIINSNLRKGGKFFFEIGYNQAEDIELIYREFSFDVHRDYQNLPRLVIGTNKC